MTKSFNRQIKLMQGRKALKLVSHIERLGAAFCKQTNLNPEEVVLLSAERPLGGHKYWYEKRSEHKTDDEVKYMFSMLTAIAEVKDGQQLGSIVADVRDFINLYKEVKDVAVTVSLQEERSEPQLTDQLAGG